jgi:hypothetical protein
MNIIIKSVIEKERKEMGLAKLPQPSCSASETFIDNQHHNLQRHKILQILEQLEAKRLVPSALQDTLIEWKRQCNAKIKCAHARKEKKTCKAIKNKLGLPPKKR